MPGAIPPGDLVIDDCLYLNYYQFDIYLACHAMPAVANKNIHGYTLRNTDNQELENFDMLVKTVKLVKGHIVKT